jgi:hypothetical protein
MLYRNLDEVTAMNAYQLGALIDVSPENDEGKAFLLGIRDAVIEATTEYDPEDWVREIVEDYAGRASEIADGAPSVYTWRKWQQFIGVAGWQEDITDYGMSHDTDGYAGAMDAGASVALFAMARRLVSALAEEVAPSDDDDDPVVFLPVNNDGYPAGADGGNMTPAEAAKYHAANDRVVFGHID